VKTLAPREGFHPIRSQRTTQSAAQPHGFTTRVSTHPYGHTSPAHLPAHSQRIVHTASQAASSARFRRLTGAVRVDGAGVEHGGRL